MEKRRAKNTPPPTPHHSQAPACSTPRAGAGRWGRPCPSRWPPPHRAAWIGLVTRGEGEGGREDASARGFCHPPPALSTHPLLSPPTPCSLHHLHPTAVQYLDDTAGTTGFTITGIHESATGCAASSPASTCPCGAAGPLFGFDATQYACRGQGTLQAAQFNVSAVVTVGGAPVASAWAAPWSAAASAAGGATLAAAVSGLTPLANRRSTAANLWCANATDATGFLVAAASVRPAVVAAGAAGAPPPAANTLGMDAALWAACASPRCAPPNTSWVAGTCTSVLGGPADDQWGAFRGVLPGPASALPGANCSLLSIDPPSSTGGTWSH